MGKKTKKKTNIFKEVMFNQYGNYTIYSIISKAMHHPNQKYIESFLKVFRENLDALKKVNFGKKLIGKIE